MPFCLSVFLAWLASQLLACGGLLVSIDLESLHLRVVHCIFFFWMLCWNFTKEFHTSVFCCYRYLFKVNNDQLCIVTSELTRNSDSSRCHILVIKRRCKAIMKGCYRKELTTEEWDIYTCTYVFHKWSHHLCATWINGNCNISAKLCFMLKEHLLQHFTRFSFAWNEIQWPQSDVSTKHSSISVLSGKQRDNQGLYFGNAMQNIMSRS